MALSKRLIVKHFHSPRVRKSLKHQFSKLRRRRIAKLDNFTIKLKPQGWSM